MNKIKKSLLVTALAAAMIIPTAQVATAATDCSFTDVSTSSSYHTPVTWACQEGITVGYSDGSFRVSQNVTRGEFATLLYRYSGETHDAGTTQDFSDVPVGGSHFTAISWMKEKGYAKGYANGTFGKNDPILDSHTAIVVKNYSGSRYTFTGSSTSYTTRGETVDHLYRMDKILNPTDPGDCAVYSGGGWLTGACPEPTTPTFAGPYTDHSATWSDGTVSSNYRIYGSHLNGQTPHGVIIYLHGDTAWEYDNPNTSMVNGDDGRAISAQNYVQVAREKGYLLVVPKTPDRTNLTWWHRNSSGNWVTSLYDHLQTKYNVNESKTYWVGFSGGADTITEQIMYTHGDADWAGGSAVIVGGGSMDRSSTGMNVPSNLKSTYPMRWFMGENDSPAKGGAGSDGYDALYYGRLGYNAYTNYGMSTSWTLLRSGNGYTGSHMDSAWEAPDYVKTLLK